MIDPKIFSNIDKACNVVAKLMGTPGTPEAALIELDKVMETYLEAKSPQQLAALLLTIIIIIELIAVSNHSNNTTAAATARLLKDIVDEQLIPYKMSFIKSGMYAVDIPVRKDKPITLQSNIIYN
jgi:hypothetical protein